MIIAIYVFNSGSISYSNIPVYQIELINKTLFNNLFFDILFNNIIVGLLILCLGFLTCGIYTIVVLFYNGFILGLYIENAFVLNISISYIIKLLALYAPLEIASFLILGSLSLKSWKILKQLFDEKILKLSNINGSIISIILPFLLIIIAAFLESKVIHLNYGIN